MKDYKGDKLIKLFSVLLLVGSMVSFLLAPNNKVKADSQISLSTNVMNYLTLSITAGGTVTFTDLIPGTPQCYATGTVASVTTNAGNGYSLAISDGSDTNSALKHTDNTTYIADMTNGGGVVPLSTPIVWGSPGSSYGLGMGLYAADNNKEAKWGSGVAVCDANNKYAQIPGGATQAHVVTGYHSSADTSSWSFKLDVPNTQKIGSYSGNMTISATSVLE